VAFFYLAILANGLPWNRLTDKMFKYNHTCVFHVQHESASRRTTQHRS
jgi:hypothetical protein